MRKTIYSIGFLVIESVFSVGLFTSCGDQFQEEYRSEEHTSELQSR